MQRVAFLGKPRIVQHSSLPRGACIDLARPSIDVDASPRNDTIGIALRIEERRRDNGNDEGEGSRGNKTHRMLLGRHRERRVRTRTQEGIVRQVPLQS